MPAVELPAMNEVGSLSEQEVGDGLTRMSRLAIVALCLALLSGLSLISRVFVPFTVLAILLSLVAAYRITRNDLLGGIGFARAGLAIGTLFFCWSAIATTARHAYYYRVAGKHAETYLAAIAKGDTYTACELRKPEPQRQLTGTNLQAIYENAAEDDKTAHKRLLDMPSTQRVLKSGPEAQWKFVGGLRLVERHPFIVASVALENAANPDDGRVIVVMRREVDQYPQPGTLKAALWNVETSRLPEEVDKP